MFKIIIFVLGWCLVGATVLPLFSADAWWVRIFDFPRLQILVLILVLLVFIQFGVKVKKAGSWILMAVLTGSFVFQAYRIYPYTPLVPVQAKPPECPNCRLRLLVSNVLMENRKSADLLLLVEKVNPDLVFLVEPDQWWIDQLGALRQRYTHYLEYPLDNTYGLALYSRFELIQPRIQYLVQDDVPSVHSSIKLSSDNVVDLYGVHPRPPVPGLHPRSTERDAELLLVALQVKAAQRPALVFGDLNDVAWSHTNRLFQQISGLLDPRIGRGIFATFHAHIPLLRWPLDHVFFSDDFRLADMRVLSGIGSDHFPISIELSFEPKGAKRQNQPSPANLQGLEEVYRTLDRAEEQK